MMPCRRLKISLRHTWALLAKRGRRMIDRKTIFITGAASGIGLATAQLFAKKGWFVGLMDINEVGLTKLQDELGKSDCFSQTGDVTDINSFRKAVEAFARETGGRMDVLFNNAGILCFGRFESVPVENSRRTVEVNLIGVLNGIHCSLEYLKGTRGSRIISMASTSALYGIPDLMVYSATKRALCAVTEGLDIELEQYGIKVSDIVAPYVKTPMVLDAPEKPFSVERMGVKIEPSQVALTVWKAVQRHKLHRRIGTPTHLLSALFWLIPGVKKSIVKALTIPPAARSG